MLEITTVKAETVEQAIAKGLSQLGLSEDQAEIHVISQGKKGIFGFGKQDAIVEISNKVDLSYSEITEQLEEEAHEEGIEEVAPSVQEKPKHSGVVEEEPVETKPEVKNESSKLEAQATDLKSVVENSNPQKPKTDGKEKTDLETAADLLVDYLEKIIDQYGAHADISYEQEDKQLIFNIDTDKSGLVIGKHGKIINSLQVLAQTFFQQHYRQRVNLLLNVGDYRDRRANVLEEMAQRTAEEVLRTKQSVILEDLPAYERKQVHAYLAKVDHIQTHSEGREPNRYLVVDYKSEH
ncbi:RNA-binding cell elongation regulator Jag/EloR [Hutsoniella sourekii]